MYLKLTVRNPGPGILNYFSFTSMASIPLTAR